MSVDSCVRRTCVCDSVCVCACLWSMYVNEHMWEGLIVNKHVREVGVGRVLRHVFVTMYACM